MNERLITRAQSVLRGFFGMGPSQFSMSDLISAQVNADMLMRGPNDCVILTGSIVGQGPGGSSQSSFALPTAGNWLVHAVSFTSTGPATSGNWRANIWLALNAANWSGVSASFGIFDHLDTVVKAAAPFSIGKWFDTPLHMAFPKTGVADAFGISVSNEAGAVGNLSVTFNALVRPCETV